MGDKGNLSRIKYTQKYNKTLVETKMERRHHLGRCRRWWEDNTKMEKQDNNGLGTSISECPVMDKCSTECNFRFIKVEKFWPVEKLLSWTLGPPRKKSCRLVISYRHFRGDSCYIFRISSSTTLNTETTSSSETSVISYRHFRGDSCYIFRISSRTTLNTETTSSSETSVISYRHFRGDSCYIFRISSRTTLNTETTSSSETSVITKQHAVIFQET